LEPDEKTKTRVRARSVCESEIITLVVCYHLCGYRTFKWFYQRLVQKYWLADFPGLPSYNRFVELMSDVLMPIAAFMLSRCGIGKGIAFIDSTSLCVCKTSASHVTLLSKMWPGAASRQRVGFMALSFI